MSVYNVTLTDKSSEVVEAAFFKQIGDMVCFINTGHFGVDIDVASYPLNQIRKIEASQKKAEN